MKHGLHVATFPISRTFSLKCLISEEVALKEGGGEGGVQPSLSSTEVSQKQESRRQRLSIRSSSEGANAICL